MELAVQNASTEGWAIFNAHTFPIIKGSSPENVTWECPCGRSIAEGIYAKQMLNVLVRCGCKRILQSPLREPGDPLGNAAFLEPCEIPIGTLLIEDAPKAIVGQAAFLAAARETGRTVPGLYEPQLHRVIPVTAESLGWIALELADLLGDEYARLMETDTRGQQHPGTPPTTARHPIVAMIKSAHEAATLLRNWDRTTPPPVLDRESIGDALVAIHLHERWRHHPAWTTLRRAMVFETEHTFTLLAVASHLIDANNGIGVYEAPEGQNERIADMWVDWSLADRVDIEVKTPVALRRPGADLGRSELERILRRQLKKSARQAKTETTAVVLGGSYLGPNYDRLLEEARSVLAKDARRWPRLAGIFVSDISSKETSHITGTPGTFAPNIRVGFAKHPGYQGDISVEYAPAVSIRAPAAQ